MPSLDYQEQSPIYLELVVVSPCRFYTYGGRGRPAMGLPTRLLSLEADMSLGNPNSSLLQVCLATYP